MAQRKSRELFSKCRAGFNFRLARHCCPDHPCRRPVATLDPVDLPDRIGPGDGLSWLSAVIAANIAVANGSVERPESSRTSPPSYDRHPLITHEQIQRQQSLR